MKNGIYFLQLGLTLILSTPAFSATLTLNEYLSQVMQASPGVKASEELIEGSELTALEKDFPTIPKFTMQGLHTVDHRQFTTSFFGGRTTSDNYGFGIEKQFDFGLAAKVSYGLLNNNTTNLPPQFYPPNGSNQYTQAQSQIDLTQSLWRNFFGKETRALADQSEAASLIVHFSEKFKLKQTKATAENAYHRLAIATELVKLENELLIGSKKILDWNSKRVQNHLTDKIDMLQARAMNQGRQLELETNLDEVRDAKLAFNTLRNQNTEGLKEEVILPTTDEVLNLTVPARAQTSDDVKAAEQNEKLTKANNELIIQKGNPELSLLATAAFNGVNLYSSPAINQSFTSNNPLYQIGFRFSFPIYFWETSQIRSGRIKQQLSAENETLQKRIEADQTWDNLTLRLKETKSRFKLASDLVAMQKEKLSYERSRFNLGRTTTYQVLTFEQDYAQAIISRLRIEQEILNIHSQLKTYAQE